MHEHRGTALAVAAVCVTFFVSLGAVVVVLGWIGFSIYALVKWIGAAPEQPNATALVLLFVGIVAVLTTLLGVGAGLVGRSMTPKKRE